MKRLAWVGSSLSDLRRFPDDARRTAGYELWRIQRGLGPSDSRPLPDLGSGVSEIRIHTDVEHRVFYVARFPEAVYVLHACEKRTRKTSRADAALIRRRCREVIRFRQGKEDDGI